MWLPISLGHFSYMFQELRLIKDNRKGKKVISAASRNEGQAIAKREAIDKEIKSIVG